MADPQLLETLDDTIDILKDAPENKAVLLSINILSIEARLRELDITGQEKKMKGIREGN